MSRVAVVKRPNMDGYDTVLFGRMFDIRCCIGWMSDFDGIVLWLDIWTL